MNASKEIIEYLKTNSANDTFLYNNRNYISKIYTREQYNTNRNYIIRQNKTLIEL